MKKSIIGSASVLAMGASLACGVFGSDDEQPAGPQGPPGGQILDGTPTDGELNETFGVFVAPGAAPGGDGSRAKPLATIKEGVAAAAAQRRRLYVCEGTLKEQVTILNGVPMIGGFECAGGIWKGSDTKRTRVESPTSPAAIASDVTTPTRIEGFELIAPNGAAPGESSIGLVAKNAGMLSLVRTKIVAQRGADGAAGTEAVQTTLTGGTGGAGKPADLAVAAPGKLGPPSNSGGLGGTGTCSGAPDVVLPRGGNGGGGGFYECKSKDGLPGNLYWQYYVHFAPMKPGAGEVRPGTTTRGQDGASAAAAGRFGPDGTFVPADGVAGTHGGPGQGGTGGAAADIVGGSCPASYYYALSASGAGGGVGGCPGLAGTPGKGGGASIGLVMTASAGLILDRSTVVAGDGGAGGRGTFGSSPTAGGLAGTNNGASAAMPGGPGGVAGVSGSGAGGSSYGIASSGGEPRLLNDASAMAGSAGAGVLTATKTDALGNARTLPGSVAGESKDTTTF